LLIEPDIYGASIVLVGSFNPAIFTPDWFVRNELLKDEFIDRDKPILVHNEFTQFDFEWGNLNCQPERFAVTTQVAPHIRILDLIATTFGEFLPHTPIRSAGLNHYVHFRVRDLEARDAIGFSLAPPEAWGDWAPDLCAKDGKRRGGLTSLTMQQQVVHDERARHIQVKVEPSRTLKDVAGIFVETNIHQDFSKEEPSAHAAVRHVTQNWQWSVDKAEFIFDQIMRKA
jgi:hypothetical protein